VSPPCTQRLYLAKAAEHAGAIYPCIYLSIHPSIYLSVYLSIYVSIFLSVYLSIYLCSCVHLMRCERDSVAFACEE